MSVTHLTSSLIDEADLAAYRHQVERLPLTMQPALHEQLNGWENLFPFEQSRVVTFIGGIGSFSPLHLESLTARLRVLEDQMGVKHWDFSANANTMENASLLARSPYYGEWRNEVQRVFSAIEAAAPQSTLPNQAAGRMVFLILPKSLPIPSITGKNPWDKRGVEFRIDGNPRRIAEIALTGSSALPSMIAQQEQSHPAIASADSWLIDADAELGGMLPTPQPPVSLLDYAILKPFRDEFLRQVNTVPKDIAATDQILAHIRREDWDMLWPASLKGQDRLRRFVIDLFLSGNGALIFSNAFVQWTSSEALRRARPRLLIARFGLRSKPKPFTSIAIFENQQTMSALHDVPDPEGSAVDALILARYVWLSVQRYPEREQTSCVCISESSGTAYVIAPEDRRPDWQAGAPVSPEALCAWMGRALRA
ncbi:MAG: hypothetical protein ACLGSD_18090 [Acidobacteriota bacterium]